MIHEKLHVVEQALGQSRMKDQAVQDALKALTDVNFALDEVLIVAITDVRGQITFANRKFCEISKYGVEELLGQNHRIINSGFHATSFFREMWRTIASGQVWRGEIRNRAKDGSFYWMDTTIVPSLNEFGKPYQYISFRNDITARKLAEEFLRRSERIAAVGEIASGIAHEIRNPLAAIQWTLQLLNLQDPVDEQRVTAMLSELERVNHVIGELLVVAKPQAAKYQEVSLDDILTIVINLMSGQAAIQRVSLHAEIGSTLRVRCEPNQLKQVLINLIKNAIEATKPGGEVCIRTEMVGTTEIRISVTDHGCGIPAELVEQIGQPFFSAKDNGTGLGMMVCHKIIHDHGGRMNIRSKINEGTTVEVILPVDPIV